MTRITLKLNKSIEENAGIYFDKAKKEKRKIEGAMEALIETKKKIEKLEKNIEKQKENEIVKKNRKKEWFEKFHWFYSSEGFLVIGGRDATSNEMVIKKQTEEHDIVFHTDMAGSPFFVIKTEKKTPTEITLKEVATATASYSRAWKKGLAETNVFYVNPDQVSKKALSGEYLAKGSFMIYGKTNYIDNEMCLAIGVNKDGVIIGGPVSAIKTQTDKIIIIIQGNTKPSDIAKNFRKRFGGDLDEIIRFVPAGGCQIVSNK